MNEADIAVSMRQVDVLFGPLNRQKAALSLLDSSHTREQILEQTGVGLGVADASLDVLAGSISVLMGLSGSGKSSLLRCVNGLNTVTRGSLNVRTQDGLVDVATCKGTALRQLRRNSLAMVFQQFALLPWASVRENIGFGLSVRGESAARIKQDVDQQLELVGLEAWAEKPIHTLSGGMQQRVGLARAFATDADILLMDEPFSALDPLIREHLQDELLALQDRLKKTILFVSHDLDEALKLGNQISIMDGGRIVQTGTADDIVFSPTNDYVKRFVANINPLSVLTARVVMQTADTMDAGGVDVAKADNSVGGEDGSRSGVAAAVGENPVVSEGVWQHKRSGLSVTLKAGKPTTAIYRGHTCELLSADLSAEHLSSRAQPFDADSSVVYCVELQTPINTLLAFSTNSVAPLLVLDDTNRLAGIIESGDLMMALRRD